MTLIKITDTMADSVTDAGQSAAWTETMKRNGITDRLMVVCSSQTLKALITRGLVERIEGSVQDGPHKGVKNFFSVLTPAGELLRKYLQAGGEARSFGEYQLIENRLPYDRAGDIVRAQQSVEDPAPVGVCGNHKDPITTCARPAGHDGQHRDTFTLFTGSVSWGPGEFATEPEPDPEQCGRFILVGPGDAVQCTRPTGHGGIHSRRTAEPEPTVCGVHPSYSARRSLGVPEDTACQRIPGHGGLHRDTTGHARSSNQWGANESSDVCGAPVIVLDDELVTCALEPGHRMVCSGEPLARRTGGVDVIETHESATPASVSVSLCDAEDPDGFTCTLDTGHSGHHVAEGDAYGYVCSTWPRETPEQSATSGDTVEPGKSEDHVAHTVKIWYSSGAYEEVGPLPQRHAATIYAECENNERVAAAEIHGHVHELIRSHLRG